MGGGDWGREQGEGGREVVVRGRNSLKALSIRETLHPHTQLSGAVLILQHGTLHRCRDPH